MIILYINLAIGVLCLTLYALMVIDATYQFKSRYPDRMLVRRSHWSSFVGAILKMAIASVCPLFNLIMLYILVVRDDEIKENTIQKVYENSVPREDH